MGQLLDEERSRPLEGDLEGFRVDRARAERLGIGLAAVVDGFGVLDRVEQIGVFGRGRRIEDPAQGEHEVVGGDRDAVRPAVVAQGEGVGQAVIGDRPALGGARDHAAVGRLGGQAHEHVAEDPVFPAAGDLMRIEAVRLAGIGDAQDPFGRSAGSAEAHRQRHSRAERGPPGIQSIEQHIASPWCCLTGARSGRV